MKIIKLKPNGSAVHFTDDCSTFHLDKDETEEYLNFDGKFPNDIQGPEIVHLEISNKCSMNCEYCYSKNDNSSQLSTDEWKEIIDDIASNNVFQITFGGHEPTLREDLKELAEYVKSKPMNLAMTTNGKSLIQDKSTIEQFDQINISYHGEMKLLEDAVKYYNKFTRVGINFLMNMHHFEDLDKVMKISKEYDAELLFLLYKPMNLDFHNKIPESTVLDIAKRMTNYGIKSTIDLSVRKECTGGKRFLTVNPIGEVYQCSFYRKSLGSLLETGLDEIWENRKSKKCPFVNW